MEEKECAHSDLEYLGSQRTEGGENLYYRCKFCHAVLIVTPRGKHVYVIKDKAKK
ncbi:MAG: hypothetical protein QXZ17_04000 [Nitrososphaerota archaeon]